MTGQFLKNLTLTSLLLPVSEEEFRSDHWEKKPLIVHRSDADFYGDLLTLQDFDGAIMRGAAYVKVTNAAIKRTAARTTGEARELESILTDLRNGSTLVLDRLNHREPKLGLLCRVLGRGLGHRLHANVYLTPPNGKGFTPHWDNHDVFILQVVGQKHWKIEQARRTFPDKNASMDDDGRELRGELYSFTLEQGDLIYIPRGFVHAAECGPEPSLHITLGVTVVCLQDLLQAALKLAVERDERLGAALPIGFMNIEGAELANLAATALRQLADERFLSAVVDQFRDELVTSHLLDISGQVVDFLQPRPLTLDDVFRPRRGVVFRMHVEDETVRLNVGARTIVFPDFFRESLDYALKTSNFSVREIPGDLADEEKIAFIERLAQEGLVIREIDSAI